MRAPPKRNPRAGGAGAGRLGLVSSGAQQDIPDPRVFQRPCGAPGAPGPHVQRCAEHLRRLGDRAIAELLVELGTRFGVEVLTIAERYRRVDPGILRAIGADRFPPSLVEVPR